MQISTDNSPPQGGVGGGPLFLRLDTNEKVEAQRSYSKGIARWQQTRKKTFFKILGLRHKSGLIY